MIDITLSGKIVSVTKKVGTSSGPYVNVVVEDRNGGRSEVYFFVEDLSAFNEIKEPE